MRPIHNLRLRTVRAKPSPQLFVGLARRNLTGRDVNVFLKGRVVSAATLSAGRTPGCCDRSRRDKLVVALRLNLTIAGRVKQLRVLREHTSLLSDIPAIPAAQIQR